MQWNHHSGASRFVALLSALLAIASISTAIYMYLDERSTIRTTARDTAMSLFQLEAQSKAEHIAGHLRDITRVSYTNAHQIELALSKAGTVACQDIVSILHANLKDPLVFGSCIAMIRRDELEQCLIEHWVCGDAYSYEEASVLARERVDLLLGDETCIKDRGTNGLFAPYYFRTTKCGEDPDFKRLDVNDLAVFGENYTYDVRERWEWFDGVRQCIEQCNLDPKKNPDDNPCLDGYMTLPFIDGAPNAEDPSTPHGSGQMMCTFSVPIRIGRNFVGIATTDIRLCDFLDRALELRPSRGRAIEDKHPSAADDPADGATATRPSDSSLPEDVSAFIVLRAGAGSASEPWASKVKPGTLLYVSGLTEAERETLIGKRTLAELDCAVGKTNIADLTEAMIGDRAGTQRLANLPRLLQADRHTQGSKQSESGGATHPRPTSYLVAHHPIDFESGNLRWSIAITASETDPVVLLDAFLKDILSTSTLVCGLIAVAFVLLFVATSVYFSSR